MKNIPGIHYVAAADIMKDRLGRTYGAIKGSFDTRINRYIDAEEMLAKEDLDAIFIATPDFWHARHTIMALEAGCHVYCEKMMSNTIEGARSMVEAMERTGKLCRLATSAVARYRTYNELIQKHKIAARSLI